MTEQHTNKRQDVWQTLADELAGDDLISNMHFVPLRDHALITVEGPDAKAFLQGQCTCDFTLLDNQALLTGAHCNPKGRMHCSFVAAQLNDNTVGLRVHKSIARSALEALKKYAVFSKATLKIDEDYLLLGIVGEQAQSALNESQPLPDIGYTSLTLAPAAAHAKTASVLCRHSADRLEVWASAQAIKSTLTRASVNALAKDDTPWQLATIKAGMAEIRADMVEGFIPQELNLQAIGGISFNKGCYTGQEIIARLHYRGRLKKHTAIGKITCDSLPQFNTAIRSTDPAIKGLGKVLYAARDYDGSTWFLALVDDSLVNSDHCELEQTPNAKIQWPPLPYAIN